jgi:hypothetical protein
MISGSQELEEESEARASTRLRVGRRMLRWGRNERGVVVL